MTKSITIEALELKKIKGKANESKKGAQKTDILSNDTQWYLNLYTKNIFDKSWENYLRALPIDRQTILFLEYTCIGQQT